MRTVWSSSVGQRTSLIVLFAALVLLSGCGGYKNSGSPLSPSTPAAASSAIVNITDSPSDRIVAFEITVTAVTFTRTDNAMYSVLNRPRRIELTHLSASAEPLVLPTLPQGTYKSVSVDLTSPEVVYIDNAGHTVKKEFANSNFSLTVPLNPNLVVGTTPMVLTLDVDAAASVTIDPVSGNVTVNPVIKIQQAAPGHENEQDPDDGEFEHIVGQVTNVSGNNFTITLMGSGASVTFTTDANTRFEGATSVASLPLNATVRVEGRTQQDGTVLATEVEVVAMNGPEYEGLVVTTTGNPVTSFDIVIQDGNGGDMSPEALGTTETVTVNANTKFRVDDGNINLGGLNVPTFSATSLSKGQRVEAESDSPQSGPSLAAESVRLQQQALVGAISAATSSQFTLTVADDSAFKLLTGKNTLTVLRQQNTELKNGVTITNAAVVRVRGLVFFDPASGTFIMVAGRLTTP